jgi:CHRD domain-containing protein
MAQKKIGAEARAGILAAPNSFLKEALDMRHRTLTVAAAVLALPFFAVGLRADDPNDDEDRDRVVRATLLGTNEVPPISTNARGTARLVLKADSIEYRVTFSGLTADSTQSHVHFAPTNVNGGVMFFFCTNLTPPAGVPPPQACPLREGTVTGTITAADVVGPAGQGITAGEFAEVLNAIRSGQSYANVHSATFGAGEVRGQLR